MMKYFSSLKPAFQFGSALTVISAIITDVLAPLSALGVWATATLFIVGTLFILKAFVWPELWRNTSTFMSELLNFPLAFCFYIATAVSAYQYGLYQNPDLQNGYLSNNVALIEALQEQIGISEETLIVQKQQLSVQLQGVEKLGEVKEVQEAQLSSQREGVSKLVEVKNAVETLNFTLYGLSEAAKIGDVGYLKRWVESGRSLSNIYKKYMPVTPPIIMDAIHHNMDEITPLLVFLEENHELKTASVFDPEAPYVKNFSVIWQNAIENSQKTEEEAKISTSYNELKTVVLSIYGIELSGITEKQYNDFKAGKINSLNLYGNTQGGQVSLLTFAKVVNNHSAIKFLSKYPAADESEYILMQGNKIRIDGEYLALHHHMK